MKLKKLVGGLVGLSLISTLYFTSCDMFGSKDEEETTEQGNQTPDNPTPDTPDETPNIFSGKTYLRENSNMVFKFISNTKVEVTMSDGTTKTFFAKSASFSFDKSSSAVLKGFSPCPIISIEKSFS